MNIRNTKLGAWLALCRVQSTPLTLVTLSLGYAFTGGDILSLQIIPLLVVGATAHWGMYAMNEHLDREHDFLAGKLDKPMVKGEITELQAGTFVTVIVALSMGLALEYLGSVVASVWWVAILVSALYNLRSKKDWFSGLYLSIWAVAVVYSGALYGGSPELPTALLALALASHMLIMTMIGDIKDLREEEPSIPYMLGCEIELPDMSISRVFYLFFAVVEGVEVLAILTLVYTTGGQFVQIIGVLFISAPMSYMSHRITRSQMFNTRWLKGKIVVYEILSVILIISACMSMISLLDAGVLIGGTLAWGMGSQTVLYGDPLYFP